jgi:hypothetical protein
MASEIENMTLVYLRRLDQKMDRLIDDVSDLKIRVTSVEEGLAGIHRRLDRFEARMDRVERRLDLADQPH